MADPAPRPSVRAARLQRVRSRGLSRAASQAGLVAALLAVFTMSAAAAGTCALVLTAGNDRALSVAVAQADGRENDNSPDITTVDVTRDPTDTDGTKAPNAATLVPLIRKVVTAAASPYPATVSIWTTTPMLFLDGTDVRRGYLLDADTLTANATLRSGAWPASPAPPKGSIPVAIPSTTAAALGAAVGTKLRLSLSHEAGARHFDLVVTGIFDPSGSRTWIRDTLNGRGYDPNYLRLPTFGPVVVPPARWKPVPPRWREWQRCWIPTSPAARAG